MQFSRRTPTYRSNYVIHAQKITAPWSEPVNLKLPLHIDPGHVVGKDGKRYLFLSRPKNWPTTFAMPAQRERGASSMLEPDAGPTRASGS
jgi:beta-xylosidase